MTKWRNVPGQRRMEQMKVDDLTLVRYKGQECYYLHARRGQGPRVDNWGPFEIDPVDPFRQAREWNDVLKAKGWFSADLATWDVAKTAKAIHRLPRSAAIPDYFLQATDNHRIASGKGVDKMTLRVGGLDVSRTDSVGQDKTAFQPRSEEASISFGKPGMKPRDARNAHMRVDGPALEALINYLLAVRLDLVSSETAEALNKETFSDTGPLSDDRTERVRSFYKIRDDIDRLTLMMMKMPPEKRDLAYLLIEQVAAGDLKIGIGLQDFEIEPEEGSLRH